MFHKNKNLLLATVVGYFIGRTLYRSLQRPYSFSGKVAVITGGSRGLGLALARELGARGTTVAIVARNDDELSHALEDLHGRGITAIKRVCNVCNEEEVNDVIASIGNELGRIDIIVNNAGTILVGPLETMEKKDFADALNLHFWAPVHLTLASLPWLTQNEESRIVNIASIGGKIAVPHLASYSASKFALVGFSDAVRSELAAQNVRVTTVCPGLMRTGSHINARFKGDHKKEYAWFSLGAAMPFVSISAQRAARQIADAVKRGSPELVITLQARAATIFQAVFPNAFARIIAFVNRRLPANVEHGGNEARDGSDCRSFISPSGLTYLGDAASKELNEVH